MGFSLGRSPLLFPILPDPQLLGKKNAVLIASACAASPPGGLNGSLLPGRLADHLSRVGGCHLGTA